MKRVWIKTGKEYEVLIERGLAEKTGALVREISPAEKVMLVSDDNVFPLYGEVVGNSLREAGFQVHSFVFPSGEEHKSLETYGTLLNAMCASKMTRSDLVVALGGGVTGDLSGFAAATFKRGIGYVQVPTTLLACVDSSVGGKTAIDLPNGKNQAGAFHQPLLTLIDPDFLKTLPEDEYLNGCAEVIKSAVLSGEALFRSIVKTPVKEQYEEVIEACVKLKRDYVEADEFDHGLRMHLNLGHTIGHAIEACSGFMIPHGQAVACGLSVIAKAAVNLGFAERETSERIDSLLKKYGLMTELRYSAEELDEAAKLDKKNEGDKMRLIVPEKIGSCIIKSIPRKEFVLWLRAGGAK